ncbi:DUF4404 family protein [Aestuariicella sp. G3-2]|uniref:DUF4404 family protein n=1 Tax=Pseudomaricurvus albidus TaxID=2842452 RepID=UPI001C0E865F|nr:DUF4404 family protein [Aestuariicella albida]MBU3070380.1 DUF4404 family protein [Aestuariicella albida]
MAMNQTETTEQLVASIKEVKALMHTALDDKQRDLLGGILESMGGGHKPPPPEVIEPEAIESLGEQLDEHAVEFETEHPRLARAIREVMDLLAKMGV